MIPRNLEKSIRIDMKLSDRTRAVPPSATVELNARVLELKRSGINVIKLNIGEPDFDTPENIREAAKHAIDNGQTRYTAVTGTLDLRQAICRKLQAENGLSYEVSEICVTTGAKQALLETMMAAVQPGDEVILPTPCWVSYESMVQIAGATPVFVSTSQKEETLFQLDLQAIERAITEKTRAIIINTPNNPTGVVYSEESLRKLAELAVKHDFLIVADEIYEHLIYGDAVHFSIASISEEVRQRVITINGFSKSYAMTGWRLGYMAGPKEFIKAVTRLQGHITSATSSISQAAGVEAISGPQDSVELMRKEFDARRQLMLRLCLEIPHVTCTNPTGAFYLMPNVSWYFGKSANGKIVANAKDLAAYLLEAAKVAVVPGDAFRAPECIRLSYSNSQENIEAGMKLIRDALAQLQ